MKVERPLLTARTLDLFAVEYQIGFSGPPWNEPWSHRSARLRIDQYHHRNADMLCIRTPENGMAAIAIGLPLQRYMGAQGIRAAGVQIATYWVAELATGIPYRNQGLATILANALKNIAIAQGFRSLGARSRIDNPGALAVFTKLGLTKHSEQLVVTRSVRSLRGIFIGRF